MRRKATAAGAIAKAKKRLDELSAQLAKRGAIVSFKRITERTRVAIITEVDGWETCGVAHTQDVDVEPIGNAAALEDACARLGTGRFFAGNERAHHIDVWHGERPCIACGCMKFTPSAEVRP